jgi:UDP-N-acetylmuramate dehydrogenase
MKLESIQKQLWPEPIVSRCMYISIQENISLAQFSTIGVGGNSKFFAEAVNEDDLIKLVKWAQDRDLPIFVLGGGSNIIVSDEGFPGLVIHLSIRGILTKQIDDTHVELTVGAGEHWDQLVNIAISNNLAGIECLSGIPGRVGATPIQNVGAYGQEVSETITALKAFDLHTNETIQIPSEECGFGYRTSRFKTLDRDRFIITNVTYRLIINGKPAIRYADLQRYLSEQGSINPSLKEVRQAVINVRKSKGMVIDDSDPDSRSVGSFFVNPVISLDEFETIKARASQKNLSLPSFPSSGNTVKLSAAWLIEHSGFSRGFIYGNVGLSSKHTLAIINRGGGKASEVIDLANKIKAQVFDQFGISLTPEPVLVGL